jgi:hypothetical protein
LQQQMMPLLALVAVSFAAGMLVGYQLGMTRQPGHVEAGQHPSREYGTSQGAGEQGSLEEYEEVSSVMEELRSSGAAAAVALREEASLHRSAASLHHSPVSPASPQPDDADSVILGDTIRTLERRQPDGNSVILGDSIAAPDRRRLHCAGSSSTECRAAGKLQTPAGARSWASDTPESGIGAAEDTEEDNEESEAGRQDREAMQAVEMLSSRSCSAAEAGTLVPMACSAVCGRPADEAGHSNTSLSLEQLHAIVGGSAARESSSVQLEHWDEVTACWAGVMRQLKVRFPSKLPPQLAVVQVLKQAS